jgi:hypothetical protein
LHSSIVRGVLWTGLALSYFLGSLYSTLAMLELVLRMGNGTGMYSDYGKSTGEIFVACAFLGLNFLWLAIGIFIVLQGIAGHMRTSVCVAGLVLTWLVVLPVTIVYLLGVGHF